MTQSKSSPEMLDELQRQAFDYFVHEVNPVNGLVADTTQENAPASIAAVGLALATYTVGVERAFITRAQAAERTLATVRSFGNSSQGTESEAAGYKGFYYHFLDMKTGNRVWKCELSTVDSAFLLAGMLTAAATPSITPPTHSNSPIASNGFHANSPGRFTTFTTSGKNHDRL